MIADAEEFNAVSKFFSSSTNTRSPARADSTLAIPVTSTASSPVMGACKNSAISLTERFIAPLYTFGEGKKSREDHTDYNPEMQRRMFWLIAITLGLVADFVL